MNRLSDWLTTHGIDSSRQILLLLATTGLAAGVLYKVGFIGWALRCFSATVRGSVRAGFLTWTWLFAWASWPVFLALEIAGLCCGVLVVDHVPMLAIIGGLVPLFMGVIACLAYVFIDLERYEVGRGYKALHNPLKGQELAVHLLQYGDRVGGMLLIAATVGVIGGFALLNQGLSRTVGAGWYAAPAGASPSFTDFLAYAIINIYRLVDLLDMANSFHYLHVSYVRATRWPASVLLTAFKTFFTLVLLQQIFASIRQGWVLSETITEFWSPHPPIHERARGTLPQHGVSAVTPLLASLRTVPYLTQEQRQQMPRIMTTIGPAAIPVLLRHLRDAHENVRAVSAAALGQLHAVEALPALAALGQDESEWVRISVMEALGVIGDAGGSVARKRRWWQPVPRPERRFRPRWFRRQATLPAAAPLVDSTTLALETLRIALADLLVTVRSQAVAALGQIGPKAEPVAPALLELLDDPDETVRCQAARALGKIGANDTASVAALRKLLQGPSPPIKAAAAQALGAFAAAAQPAVPALVKLTLDADQTVREAAAQSIARVGALDEPAMNDLVQGLASSDNMVRAYTAEALGIIGEAAREAAPALVAALQHSSDRVRAKAAEALGRMGEAAAHVAVPGLMQALRGPDSWVSALAAEALGEMGEAADRAVPALVRSLRHRNPTVRANAAAALAKLGDSALPALPALEAGLADPDGAVRSQLLRALGAIGNPTARCRALVLAALQDVDPQVRAAAVEALGHWDQPSPTITERLLTALDDPNDQVKLQVLRVLPALTHASEPVLESLGRRLLEDDNHEVQVAAALALGQFGRAASSAGEALLRAAQTGAADVREQALRAIAIIQPPQTAAALTLGLKDASSEIRKVASGGWMKASEIPDDATAALIECLRDPEAKVRANAAHALSRLPELPATALPHLLACAADPEDAPRLAAALALQGAPPNVTRGAMMRLLDDGNPRVRLLAAGTLLAANGGHPQATAIVREGLTDATLRLRKAAVGIVDSLGEQASAFLPDLQERLAAEDDPALVDALAATVERLQAGIEEEASDEAAEVQVTPLVDRVLTETAGARAG
ncbi:MAG: HEAT repeat domain-containing protein [Planctomycetia bacterium]|nr:HEAT repeat domain-containing protein [Planctomycetia bacterium]